MRLVGCVCGVTGTSSVQSDCLWKELVFLLLLVRVLLMVTV